jgi:hypothetical protein
LHIEPQCNPPASTAENPKVKNGYFSAEEQNHPIDGELIMLRLQTRVKNISISQFYATTNDHNETIISRKSKDAERPENVPIQTFDGRKRSTMKLAKKNFWTLCASFMESHTFILKSYSAEVTMYFRNCR